VSSASGRASYGKLYTRASYAALAVSSKKEAADAHDAGTVLVLLEESRGAEHFKTWLTQTLASCEADVAAQSGKLTTSTAAHGGALIPREQVTMPLDVLAGLGAPFHEDYNADGRFVYTYETKVGMDAYLFDVSGRLIRMRSYCDATKARCPEPAK
jgi:hypothetical protein